MRQSAHPYGTLTALPRGRRGMIRSAWPGAILLFGLLGCTPAASPAANASPAPRTSGLRTSAEVADALDRAQAAFLAGRWGEAVVAANQVMEGAAGPDEYYLAVKILGLASCNRKDPRPVTFSFTRMRGADREALRNECAQHGLGIDDQGVVGPR